MVKLLFLAIILIISIYILLARVSNVILLICAVFTFAFSSIKLLLENHILVGSVFLIVYAGAILVFLCISLLVSPQIESKFRFRVKSSSEWTSSDSKYKLLLLLGMLVVLFLSLVLYFQDSTCVSNVVFEYNMNLFPIVTDSFILPNKDFISDSSFNASIKFNDNFVFENIMTLDMLNLATTTTEDTLNCNFFFSGISDLNVFDYNSVLSNFYKEDGHIIFAVGIYLLLVLLGCLILFSISQHRKVIKRQDAIDQVLKRWFTNGSNKK